MCWGGVGHLGWWRIGTQSASLEAANVDRPSFVSLVSMALACLVFGRYAVLRDLTPVETGILVLLSFALAVATWRFIELPVRAWLDKRTHQRVAIFSAGAAVLAIGMATGAASYVTHGFPSRAPDTIAVLRPWENLESARDTLYRSRSCFLLPDQNLTNIRMGRVMARARTSSSGAIASQLTYTLDWPKQLRTRNLQSRKQV